MSLSPFMQRELERIARAGSVREPRGRTRDGLKARGLLAMRVIEPKSAIVEWSATDKGVQALEGAL